MPSDPVQGKTIIKNLLYVLVFLIGSVGLEVEAFSIFGTLIVLDTVTGIIKSGIVRGWTSVTSVKATSGVLAKMLIIFVPLIIAWAGRGAGIPLLGFAKGALSILILAEAYSVIGNIHAIARRKEGQEFDAVSWSINVVKRSLEKLLKATGNPDKYEDMES